MKLKKNIRFLLLGVLCSALFLGCSTKKNTSGTRAYHELTTRYNVFFNAEQLYNETLLNQTESFKDNYAELLPFFPFTPTPDKTQPGGAFDGVIKKTEKAIREHSISAKPKRDASQSQTQEYRDWLRQQEFNPFIKNVWLLMGKAHIQNQDYDRAIEVFSQTIQLFKTEIDVVSEAQIWMLRAYTEMNRLYDAEDIAYILQSRTLPKPLHALFTQNYAYYLLRKKEYEQAAPFLRQTIDNESNPTQKKRLQFLLGQIYALLGQNEQASHAFESIKGLSTPYEFTLNAVIQQSVIARGSEQQSLLRELEKMSKSNKSKEQLDKVYFAIGNIYLQRNDTTKAIHNYTLAEKETSVGMEKALAQIALGDIYFARKDFVKAEPRYMAAITTLPKTHSRFEQISFRSEALKELTPHITAVEEQDSIRHLTQLPRNEQLKIIRAHISEIKKSERAMERDSYLAEQQTRAPQLNAQQQPSVAEANVALANKPNEGDFYFYNPQLVAQGKAEFQRRWGNRALKDNWRTQAGTSFSSQIASQSPSPSVPQPQTISTDPLSPDFYLQQLPTTPEAIAKSDSIIENGLFNMGNITVAQLQDFDYATHAYNRLLRDFPKSKNTSQVYYRLYLIYLRTGNDAMAQSFKQRLMREFPENENAVAISQPGFEANIRNIAKLQDALYQKAYDAYRKGDAKAVQSAYATFLQKYPNSDLQSKFLLLNALSYAQTGDAEKTESALKELLRKFPDSDAAPMAQNIVDGLSQGRTLAVNASAIGSINTKQTPSGETLAIDTLRFTAEVNAPHLYLLTFAPQTINKNALLFAVANFNFSNFQLRTFQLSFTPVSSLEALQVKEFRSFAEAASYARMIQSDTLLLENAPDGISPVIISEENLNKVLLGENWDDYLQFYTDSLGGELTDSTKISIPMETEEEATPTEPEKIVPLENEPAVQPEKKPVEPTVPQTPVQKQTRVTPEERQAELERKAAEATQQQQKTAPRKSREEILKERERERKEKIRQREIELKERQRQREAELKQREREREQKLREQERTRQENLRKREQQLRQRNR